jgi:hypothetical protein
MKADGVAMAPGARRSTLDAMDVNWLSRRYRNDQATARQIAQEAARPR